MSLPTLQDLAALPRIRFPEGNGILYGRDFRYYHGIPHGVDWWIADIKNGTVELVRDGHGVKENYGDGSLLVKADLIFPSAH